MQRPSRQLPNGIEQPAVTSTNARPRERSTGKGRRARLLSGRIALISMQGALTKPGSEWRELPYPPCQCNRSVSLWPPYKHKLAGAARAQSRLGARQPLAEKRSKGQRHRQTRAHTNAALKPPATIDHVIFYTTRCAEPCAELKSVHGGKDEQRADSFCRFPIKRPSSVDANAMAKEGLQPPCRKPSQPLAEQSTGRLIW
ncbi:hypothetical protein HPB51_001095 [Rhipicephalus microplus]|uniref:Uncharacterized protein n=1 Tax=Rhipicephalus microplus TaxID=6941 RepID=A0A9J6D7R4_RHIMP|nr:hypothetical protein HPB51_001095 [Rhipicephalus microplus]